MSDTTISLDFLPPQLVPNLETSSEPSKRARREVELEISAAEREEDKEKLSRTTLRC